jgi:hypothetical protein
MADDLNHPHLQPPACPKRNTDLLNCLGNDTAVGGARLLQPVQRGDSSTRDTETRRPGPGANSRWKRAALFITAEIPRAHTRPILGGSPLASRGTDPTAPRSETVKTVTWRMTLIIHNRSGQGEQPIRQRFGSGREQSSNSTSRGARIGTASGTVEHTRGSMSGTRDVRHRQAAT